MLARARPAATPSSSSPTRNRNTTTAASSVAPMITAPTAAMVISFDRERRAGHRRHEGAPRDRHQADQHCRDEDPSAVAREDLRYGKGGHQPDPGENSQTALRGRPPRPPWSSSSW